MPSAVAVCAFAGERPCYTGRLFDAHLHASGYTLLPGQNGATLLTLLDRDGISYALGFYGTPGEAASIQRSEMAARRAQSRVVPLIGPALGTAQRYLEDFSAIAPNGLEQLFGSYFRPSGTFAGIGEVALYFPSAQSITLDSSELRQILAAANSTRSIAMIHPRSQQPNPTTQAEVAAALRDFPNVTFVFHGDVALYDLIEPLMNNYPNVFYSLDFPSWRTGLSWGSSLDRAGTSAGFQESLARVGGVTAAADNALQVVANRIALHPDRVLWGTDRFLPYHFEAEVSGPIIEISRLLIGQLPANLQEPFAFGNALRVIGPYLR